MKAIPEQLRAYFPNATDPARPWWRQGALRDDRGGGLAWRRNDEACYYQGILWDERAHIDKRDPLPPPHILVGQVWGVLGPDNATLVVFTILSVITQPGKPLTARGAERTWFDTQLWGSGFLLACPYGNAPWSGPEIL